MNDKKSLEARLHRSLGNQIAVPKLDGRFDAAVWARIEKADAKSRATTPIERVQAARGARLMFLCNAIGGALALALVAWFVVQQFGGPATDAALSLQANLPANVTVPRLSDDMTNRVLGVGSYLLSAVVLAFGVSFTSFGHRIRASFG